MTEKLTQKIIRVAEEYAGNPPLFLGDALLDIFASPPTIEAVNVILNQNHSLKIQRRFMLSQNELTLFNSFKSFYGITHDYLMAHIIFTNFHRK